MQQGRGQNRHPNHRSAEPDSTQKEWLEASDPSVAAFVLLEGKRGPKELPKKSAERSLQRTLIQCTLMEQTVRQL